jgi:hypothetical protein
VGDIEPLEPNKEVAMVGERNRLEGEYIKRLVLGSGSSGQLGKEGTERGLRRVRHP